MVLVKRSLEPMTSCIVRSSTAVSRLSCNEMAASATLVIRVHSRRDVAVSHSLSFSSTAVVILCSVVLCVLANDRRDRRSRTCISQVRHWCWIRSNIHPQHGSSIVPSARWSSETVVKHIGAEIITRAVWLIQQQPVYQHRPLYTAVLSIIANIVVDEKAVLLSADCCPCRRR